jgi:hypothetical protein
MIETLIYFPSELSSFSFMNEYNTVRGALDRFAKPVPGLRELPEQGTTRNIGFCF